MQTDTMAPPKTSPHLVHGRGGDGAVGVAQEKEIEGLLLGAHQVHGEAPQMAVPLLVLQECHAGQARDSRCRCGYVLGGGWERPV